MARIPIPTTAEIPITLGGGNTNTADNTAPFVSAGRDRSTVENQAAPLEGTASDIDGTIQTIQWRQLAGPEVTIDNPASLQTQFQAPDVANNTDLVFELRVTDNSDATSSDQVTITVTASSNNGGIARALWNGPIAGANVSFFEFPGSLTTPIHNSQTSGGAVDAAGFFDAPSTAEPESLYLVRIQAGGQDVDRNRDGEADGTPRSLLHDFHAVVRGDRLNRAFTVNPVSELLYRRVSLMLNAGYSAAEVEAELNRHAAIILRRDVNGDGAQNIDDLLSFSDTTSGTADLHESLGTFRDELENIYRAAGLPDDELRHFTDRFVGTVSFSGHYDDVQVRDGVAYLIQSQFDDGILEAFSVGPANLDHGGNSTPLSRLEFPDAELIEFDVDDGIAVLVGEKTHFADVSNPADMQLIQTRELSSLGVEIADNRAYVIEPGSNFARTLHIFDLSTAGSVVSLGSTVLGNGADKIKVRGDLAYTYGGTVEVLDISNPSSVVVLGSIDVLDIAFGLDLVGDHLYTVGNYFHVIDISTPTAPTISGMHRMGGKGVFVRDDMAYIAGWDEQPEFLSTLDVSNPSRPRWVGNLKTESLIFGSPNALTLIDIDIEDGTDVGIAAGSLQPGKIDISSPSSLAELGREDFHDNLSGGFIAAAQALDIAAQGDFAYVAETDHDTPRALNISDPRNPVLTNTGDVPGNSGDCEQVRTHRGFLYAHCGNRLATYGLSNPADPQLVTTTNVEICDFELQIRGDRLVTACFRQLDLLDLSTPGNPQVLGNIDYSSLGRVSDFDITNDHIYVVNFPRSQALNVFSMTNPSAPQAVGTLNLPDEISSFRIQDDLLTYCYRDSSFNNRIRFLRLTGPTTFTEVANHVVPTGCDEQKISGDFMILGAGGPLESGLTVLNISDLQNITTVGFYPVLDRINSVVVHNGLLLTTQSKAGAAIYRMPISPQD